jgi:hypothetical protein
VKQVASSCHASLFIVREQSFIVDLMTRETSARDLPNFAPLSLCAFALNVFLAIVVGCFLTQRHKDAKI